MNAELRIAALLSALCLLFYLLAGCQTSPAAVESDTPNSTAETGEREPWNEEEALKNIYSNGFILSDEVWPDKYPPPTDQVSADAEAFLTARQNAVKDFWAKNQLILEAVAAEFFSLAGQDPERKFYYEIADNYLLRSLRVPEDAADAELLQNMKQALKALPGLAGTDLFERVYVNSRTLRMPFCEFSGALKLFDGIACYVSLAFFPEGEHKSLNDKNIQALDEHWALFTFQTTRNELGQTLPREKYWEARDTQTIRQAWKLYHYWLENRALFEEIAEEEVGLCERNPGYLFGYTTTGTWDNFDAYPREYDMEPYETESASDKLMENLRTLCVSGDELIFSHVGSKEIGTGEYLCDFNGNYLFADGESFWNALFYTTGNAADEADEAEVVLDPHWSLAEVHTYLP